MQPNNLIPAPRKAERQRVKLKIAVQGPSGSGKTYGALALAKNLFPGAKVLVVDTENESASLYADMFEFDTIPLSPPFNSVRYHACIDAAVSGGYDVLLIDSISHEWDGDGGILDRKGEVDNRGGNSYTNWAKFTTEHTKFKEAIIQAPLHIIATMRSKTEYVLEDNGKGKQVPRKVGMAPIQREGMEYEFSLVFDMQMDHKAVAIKNRTGLFGDSLIDLKSAKVAEQLREWMQSGVERKPEAPPAVPAEADMAWHLDEDNGVLDCRILNVERREKKNKGGSFLAVKHNGKVGGKDLAFCFHLSLEEALLAAKGKRAKLQIEVSGEYVNVEDVVAVDGVYYCDGKPDDSLNITEEDAAFVEAV